MPYGQTRKKSAVPMFGLYAGYASQFLFVHGNQYHGRNRAIGPNQSSTERLHTCPHEKKSRNESKDDGIRFLLAQFVDMNGSAKVKMVPANCLDDVADTGAGFAGAALWGMGQGPHSHDMMARIDLDTYTPSAVG